MSRKRDHGGALLVTLVSVTILSSVAIAVYSHAAATRIETKSYLVTERNRLGIQSGIEAAKAILEQTVLPGIGPLDPTGKNTAEIRLSLGDTEVYVLLQDESGKVSTSRGEASFSRLSERVSSSGGEGALELQKALALVAKEAAKPRPPGYIPSWGGILQPTGISSDVAFGKPKFGQDAPVPVPKQKVPALADIVTPVASPRLNLNSAGSESLFALHPVMTGKVVESVQGYRRDRAGFARAFQAPEDLQNVPGIVERRVEAGREQVIRNLFLNLKDLVTVQSGPYSARIWAKTRDRVDGAFVLMKGVSATSGGVQMFQALAIFFEGFEP